MRSAGSAPGECHATVLESQIDQQRSVAGAAQRRFIEVPPADGKQRSVLCSDLRDDRLGTSGHDGPEGLREHPSEAADSHAGDDATDDQCADRRDAAADHQHLSSPPPSELIAVSPGRKFGPQRLADPHERRSVAHLGQAYVVGRQAAARIGEQLLGRFDRFPALLERRQIPAFAVRADDPQPPALGVERQALADRKRLERLIGAERLVAKQTGGIHNSGESEAGD